MIVIKDESSQKQRRMHRWSRWWLPMGAVVMFVAGGLAGVFVIQDAAARERIRLAGETVRHFGRYTQALWADTSLDTLRIEMKDGQRHVIRAARDEAMASGVLFADEQPWVTATVAVRDIGVPVQMRLKGLLEDHRNTDKWSYRISMRDEHAWNGMTSFSIQHPGTRGYLNEWLYLESIRREGLLAPRYDFTNVMFNGTNSGVFAVEEHVTREWLESQGRRDGIILRMDDTDIWRQYVTLGHHFGGVFPAGFTNLPVEEFHAKRVADDGELTAQRDAAVRLLIAFTTGEKTGSQVFDVEQTSRFLALHELWSSDHALGPPNARFYFNAMTGRFEPIAGDAESDFNRSAHFVSLPIHYHDHSDVGKSIFWAPLYLQDLAAMEAFVRELTRVAQPQYLDELQAKVAHSESRYLAALRREYPQVQPPWDGLRRRQAQLRNMLAPPRTVLAYGSHDGGKLRLEVANALGLPVEVLAIQIDGQETIPVQAALAENDNVALTMNDRSSVILPLKQFDQRMRYARFAMPFTRSAAQISADPTGQPTVRLRTRILGHDREVWADVKMGRNLLTVPEGIPASPTIDEALARYPFLEQTDDGALRIRAGTWDIAEDFVLPHGVTLQADAGTTLRFASHAAMLSRGPVILIGEPSAPIILEAAGESWPGLIVLNAKQPSSFRHVIVRNTRGIDRAGWRVPAGVTFHKSAVTIDQTHFLSAQAAHALHIDHAPFTLQQLHFNGCAFDGLHLSHSRGTITDSLLADIQCDAISTIATEVNLVNVTARHIGRHALACAEDSRIELNHFSIASARYGIISKDASFIVAQNLDLTDVQLGLAAYNHKPAFGPAAINAGRTRMNNVAQPCLVQTESWIKLNGQKHFGAAIDVRALEEE